MIAAATLAALLAMLGIWVVIAHGRLVRAQDRIYDAWGVLEDILERRHDPMVALARRAQGRLGVARNAGARVDRLAQRSREAYGPADTARAEAALDAEVAALLHAATLPDARTAATDAAAFDEYVDRARARGAAGNGNAAGSGPRANGLRRDGLGEGFEELEVRRDGLGAMFDELAVSDVDAAASAGSGVRDGLGDALNELDAPEADDDDAIGVVEGYEAFGDLGELPDHDHGLGEYLAEIGELPEAPGDGIEPGAGGPEDMLRRLGKLNDRVREAAEEYNAAAGALNGMVNTLRYGYVARVFGFRLAALFKPKKCGGEKDTSKRQV